MHTYLVYSAGLHSSCVLHLLVCESLTLPTPILTHAVPSRVIHYPHPLQYHSIITTFPALSLSLARSLAGGAIFLCSLLVASGSTLLGAVITLRTASTLGAATDANGTGANIVSALCFVTAFALTQTVLGVLSTAARTVFVCFAMAPAAGARTHPAVFRALAEAWAGAMGSGWGGCGLGAACSPYYAGCGSGVGILPLGGGGGGLMGSGLTGMAGLSAIGGAPASYLSGGGGWGGGWGWRVGWSPFAWTYGGGGVRPAPAPTAARFFRAATGVPLPAPVAAQLDEDGQLQQQRCPHAPQPQQPLQPPRPLTWQQREAHAHNPNVGAFLPQQPV